MSTRLNTDPATARQKLYITKLAMKLNFPNIEYIPMTKGEAGRNIATMKNMLKANRKESGIKCLNL